jgi:hypothetical protein
MKKLLIHKFVFKTISLIMINFAAMYAMCSLSWSFTDIESIWFYLWLLSTVELVDLADEY